MSRNTRAGIALALLVMVRAGASAWDWPIDTPDVARSFLSIYGGDHHNGLILKSRTSAVVRTIDPGVVVFAAPPTPRPHTTRTPHVLGGVVVVEHANRFRTVYGNVRPLVTSGRTLGARERIARVDSERDDGALNVILNDERQQSFVNLLLLLPRLRDSVRPSIYYFGVDFGTSMILGDYFNVRVGALDRRVVSASVTPVIPPFVAVSYQSQGQSVLLDNVRSDGRYLYSSTARTPSDLFTPNGEFLLGPFRLDPDQEFMEIRVADYSGLSRVIRASIYDDEE